MTEQSPPNLMPGLIAGLVLACTGLIASVTALVYAWFGEAGIGLVFLGVAVLALMASAAVLSDVRRRQRRHYGL